MSNDTLQALRSWLEGPRFAGVIRLYGAEQVAEQRGTIPCDYSIARQAAEDFWDRLRELFGQRKSITTFGPYSPGQAVAMKRAGIEGIYIGGWATSAKGSTYEDPGADLASYPLSQVPEEAAVVVRALLTADRNQHFARARMNAEQREAHKPHDFRPFVIADADTGHGGDAHVRNLVRRFVEVGVPGYHIEDQRPGTKKCGHQGGKVLVSQDEQIKRLNAARFQLDVMGVPGLIVARTDAEAATLLDGNADERDQPYILGATNLRIPPYKHCFLALIKAFFDAGHKDINGHLLYAMGDGDYSRAGAWLDSAGVIAELQKQLDERGEQPIGRVFDAVANVCVNTWAEHAGLATYPDAVADVMELRSKNGEQFDVTVAQWRELAMRSSLESSRLKAQELDIDVDWDCERARTPEGFYQIRGGLEFATSRSLHVAPFCDILWMETKTADLKEAREFAEAVHARFPDKLLAYNLSPSFSWDTTGMSDDEMRRFPQELGKLGFVFNFITYGGHQIDGLAAEEFSAALNQDGMLALAKLQRKFRLLESPYKTPQTLVGGPRLDAALTASSGRTATTKAMGKGSTQFQHLIQTEVPPTVLEGWLASWAAHYDVSGPLQAVLRPHRAGSELLELQVVRGDDRLANLVFERVSDRRGRRILSVRDQNTFDTEMRQRRLMTLVHVFLLHRYQSQSVHYLTPTELNEHQTAHMKSLGIFTNVHAEVGQIIVANVSESRIAELVATDNDAMQRLITKQD